jgi:hypothetical protein
MAALFSCVIRARVIFSDFNADQTRPSAPRSFRARETRRKSQVGHQCWCRLQQRALRNRFRHLQHQPPLLMTEGRPLLRHVSRDKAPSSIIGADSRFCGEQKWHLAPMKVPM